MKLYATRNSDNYNDYCSDYNLLYMKNSAAYHVLGSKSKHPAEVFRNRITSGRILPVLGIYDVFSAKIVAKYFESVFCSGFSFSASYLGKPDIGYIGWRDMLEFACRLRLNLPHTHILVDAEDGFGDKAIASDVICYLESIGISALVLEDQKRPRRCGHFANKQLLTESCYIEKLQYIRDKAKNIFIIARTDAAYPNGGLKRVIKYAQSGADAVLIDAIGRIADVKDLVKKVCCPVVVNQIYGGKTPIWSLKKLEDAGVSAVIYSTPCLFSAQYAIEQYIKDFQKKQILPDYRTADIKQCNELLSR